MENLNNPATWTSNEPPPMSKLAMQQFQKELDAIVGLEPDGKSRLRLVWGQNLKETETWDRYQQAYRPRYAFKRETEQKLNPLNGLYEPHHKWIGIPRFYIEAYVPQIHLPKEQAEAGTDADGDTFAEDRTVGGMYITATPIYQHSEIILDNGWRPCCFDAIQEKRGCYGLYREPDDFDLQTVREGMAARQEAGFSRPDQKLNDDDKRLAYLGWLQGSLRDERKRKEEAEYARKDILKTILPWADGLPGKLGRFSI